MCDRIADDAINSGCHIHLIDAVDVAQFLRGHLSRSGFLPGSSGGEGEDAAGADSQVRG